MTTPTTRSSADARTPRSLENPRDARLETTRPAACL